MTLIDTAEMYGEGGAEEVVGEAIAGRRDEVFLVSKVYPHNASRRGAVAACERSLQAAQDRPARPLSAALARRASRWRRRWTASSRSSRPERSADYGVSNFDPGDMEELPALSRRRRPSPPIRSLQPDAPRHRVGPAAVVREHGIPVMAYSPFVSAPPALTRLLSCS